MTGNVTLPLWLAAVVALLAIWAVLERLLIPGVRWFFRRRAAMFIEEINKRLHLEIHPFAMTRRQVLIDRLMYDPRIMEAAGICARRDNVPRDAVMAEVGRYAREIVPSFNAYAYFRLGYWLARRAARMLYRVRVGFTDDAGLSRVHPKSSVVFVMNHRSNMDYILVAYLAATRTALSYAVGEWARIWPLQALIRSLGAYFIRRKSGNPLYRLVLERYVGMATESGVVQAIFPEGGLSRDGTLRPPKLGLLDYMLRSFPPEGERDLVFIPVGINYDRTLEDRSLLADLEPAAERKSFPFALAKTFGFFFRNLYLMLRGRWYRFGYACVNFGTPLSMKDYCRELSIDFRSMEKEERFPEVEALARRLMDSVGNVIPVLPVSLVATAFLRNPGTGLSALELKAEVHRCIRGLGAGARVYIPRGDQDYAVDVGLRMLMLRRLVDERDGLYSARPDELPLLCYYANAITHLFRSPDAASR
ncbi:MAG: 1-acyl-sn-glycerol-3-phosphate acyltransferase [Deltaproteobacteria bacterium]|nr:1-acyl-sn-glycerol-3-phosphate acyltransferase [Deltaproteobacteria bacterium]